MSQFFQMMNTFGASLGGPCLGVFALGLFIPWTNWKVRTTSETNISYAVKLKDWLEADSKGTLFKIMLKHEYQAVLSDMCLQTDA